MSEAQQANPYETWSEKAKRKFDENPWVPIGCLATTGALIMSAVKMRQGKSQTMNYWLRARVGLQGVTLVALVVGAMSIKEAKRKQEELENGPDGASEAQEKKKDLEKLQFEARMEEARQAVEEEEAMGLKGMRVVSGPAVKTARRDERNKQEAAKAEVASSAETTTTAVKKSSSWKIWSKDDNSE